MFQYAPHGSQAWDSTGVPGIATGAAGAGARAFVPPLHNTNNITPYNEDFAATPQRDDNYYYSSTTPVAVSYSNHGEGEYYDNNAGYQPQMNNGYYGYTDTNDNQGYYNEGYHHTGVKTYNNGDARHADYAYGGEVNDPHHNYSKPDARE